MTFPGLPIEKDRRDVIEYLKEASETKAAVAGGGAAGGKPDLKKAPPEGRVTSLEYCRDTYTVTTADGKSGKVPEFNLRLKTDSSDTGPLPGKPVAIGAGMSGDRASIIFATPSEISEFIRRTCR